MTNRAERERRLKSGLPPVPGSTRRSGESRRAQRKRVKAILPPYKPEGGNNGSNINQEKNYVDGIWSGTAPFEG